MAIAKLNSTVAKVTDRIMNRSEATRAKYEARVLDTIERNGQGGVIRSSLTCGNFAHACAAANIKTKQLYKSDTAPNIGIVTAYNDMLSAHQPFKDFPELMQQEALRHGATAQVAGGVPAMCDGVTQGQTGMELSLFSRDVIALSASVALSHQCFDAAIFLGVCDKIIPGLTIAAATYGHLPAIMAPAGPMPSGLDNETKAKVRQQFASGNASKETLLKAEMGSYHSAGTCTFYGTANSNQLIMEMMGLHLPGATFINPNTPLRDALTRAAVKQVLDLTYVKGNFLPVYKILHARNFVNGMVGLLSSGGSTNLLIHLVAMARSAGYIIDPEDFTALSDVVPLLCRIYPNGLADINALQNAGGMPVFIYNLLQGGLIHKDIDTVMGNGIDLYLKHPQLEQNGSVNWTNESSSDKKQDRVTISLTSTDEKVLRDTTKPFAASGGLQILSGNLGRAVIKTSSIKPEQFEVEAPAVVFHRQEDVKAAFEAGELNKDFVCVMRYQGPAANGMPELHGLTPILGALQSKGYQVALVTDGRMSGASGKIPAAIHVSPEALSGGNIAKIKDGDKISLNAHLNSLNVLENDFEKRERSVDTPSIENSGNGRELFELFRNRVSAADEGASVLF